MKDKSVCSIKYERAVPAATFASAEKEENWLNRPKQELGKG